MKNPTKTFNDLVFMRVSEETYWKIIQFVVDDLNNVVSIKGLNLTHHEHCFARFCILATSSFGGCFWKNAISSLCNLKLGNVKSIITGSDHENNTGMWIHIPHSTGVYPIFMLPIVELSLLSTIVCCMKYKPSKNNGLTWPGDNISLAPYPDREDLSDDHGHSTYRRGIIEKYLNFASNQVCKNDTELEDFISAGCQLANYQYDQDVLCATLRLFNSNVCIEEEYKNPNIIEKIKNYRGTL